MSARSSMALGLLLTVGLLAPTSAFAVHVFKGSFGGPGHGDGQLELLPPVFKFSVEELAGSNLALNEASGDVYVADTGNHRVDQFTAAGTFIRSFGADVGGAGVDVCASACVAGATGSTPGAFEAATMVAVDNDPLSPSHGDVYVADTAAGLVTKFEADGALVSSWGVGGQLDGSTATSPIAGPFAEIAGIVVDAAGNLDVLENGEHALFRFAQDGSFIADFETPRGSAPGGLGVDPEGDFFKLNGSPTVEKFTSSGTDIGQVSEPEPSTGGVAVDPSNGDVYRDTGTSIETYAFNGVGEVIQENGLTCTPLPSDGCERTTVFGTGNLNSGAGLAVDSAHTAYVADAGVDKVAVFDQVTNPTATTGVASPVGAASATLNGTVNPNGLPLKSNPSEGCFFEWGETNSYGNVAPCEAPNAAEVGSGSAPLAVHAGVPGLHAGTTYHFRLVAENASAPSAGEDEEFKTLGPSIKEEAATQVSASGARISGQVDPNGQATSFAVEYVSAADFDESGYAEATSVPAPAKEVGAAAAFVEVVQQLSGLNPDTTYHFRLVATNPAATVRGEDRHFSTFPQVPVGLPDGRAYELVTPAQKLGEPFPPEPTETLGGTCRIPRPACAPGNQAELAPMQSSADGSAFVYEGLPFSENLASGPNQYLASRGAGGWETEGLSKPLFDGTFRAVSADLSRGVLIQEQPLTPEAPTRGGLGFLNLYLWQEGALQPVLTEEPPHRDPGSSSSNRFKLSYEGANAGTPSPQGREGALSHVLFAANDALTAATPFAPKAPEVGAGKENRGCNVGENCNLYEWNEGQLRLVNVLPGNAAAAPGAVIGSRPSNDEPPDVDHAISDDGSRIFWSNASGQVYVRINGEETEKIEHPGGFVSASNDGSEVLLGDGCLYDLEEEECEELTADQSSVPQGGFQGILGASEELSRVYFVDTKALTGEEENANEEKAKDGADNLYLWSEGAPTTFIGTLLEIDNKVAPLPAGKYGDWTPSSARRTAQVSADGGYLAFMSQARLTGYDNRQLSGTRCSLNFNKEDQPCFEVFAYDAATGSLACPSCNPSGERPLGQSNLSLFTNKFAEAEAALPPPHSLTTDGEGRLFFESQDTLSPHDTNGHIQDVYEWEPDEVGSCRRAGGCVSLISSGDDGGDSMFVNSTPSGNDAFFTTRERLLARDKNEQVDIYDARAPRAGDETVGFPEGETAPCGEEACKGPVAGAPPTQNAGSAQFSGPGNAKPPKAKKHHKKQKKHKAKKKRSAKHNRGGAK
jgi:hypothetical protein